MCKWQIVNSELSLLLQTCYMKEWSQSANDNENIASVFISRNACMCCIIVNSREKEDHERDIIKTLNTENKNMTFCFFFFFFINPMGEACFPVRIRLGELLSGSQPIYRTCVVWSWRLKECFALVASPVNGLWYTALSYFRPDGDATLMSPNKGETGSSPWLPLRLCACVRYWSVSWLVFVCR